MVFSVFFCEIYYIVDFVFHISIKMGREDKLEKLINNGFAGIREEMKDFKAEMKGVREEINDVTASTTKNTKKLGYQAEKLAEVQDQVRELILSDQDRRRRAGHR